MSQDILPNFSDFLNEGSSDQKTLAFDTVNGYLKIRMEYQETDGYDSVKPMAASEAEIRLSFEHKDRGLMYYYNSSNYEEDKEKFLEDIKELADKFDKELLEILEKRNFSK
jgi:hypothetical protein